MAGQRLKLLYCHAIQLYQYFRTLTPLDPEVKGQPADLPDRDPVLTDEGNAS